MGIYRDRLFPLLLGWVSRHFDDDRRRLLGEARGRVLELGVGTGASLGFYGEAVDEVVGIDHSPAVLRRAAERLRRKEAGEAGLPHAVILAEADAQALPYDDASFDTVVAFLTLCSVPDPDEAAREIRRVLKPGGALIVLEHVRAHREGRLAAWQDRLDPIWSRAAVGCHLNRDTAAALARAGFDTAPLERYRAPRTWRPASPRIRGVLLA
ncbi:MAG TPA: class I SAM-dependent methyltransferase [Longimicrobiales bacterium]|nr:class I SAM-dependent methyltransferase [Longimicrobiales bacterium]